MNIFELLNARRAVKNFDSNFVIPNEDIEKLLSAATLAPSAFNIQHWRFVIIKNRELRNQLRSAARDQPQVTDASLLIVLCADLQAWTKDPAKYWENVPQAVRDFIVSAIHNYYADRPEVQRDETMRSCGIVAQTIMLTAKEMGYDSCPMDGFDFAQVAKIINLPNDHIISMMIAIGKSNKEPFPRATRLPLGNIIINDQFITA
ncbi:MAG: nitroreductase family protein [Deltaproteobacteria bacterium]|nr:nitroreductase family protein [Deltaproteobacteria bacterium]